ncbi:MAG: cytochrome c3 family protein [Raoultibacter sp.]
MNTNINDAQEPRTQSIKPRPKHKTIIISSVVVAVIIVASIGFFVWHEQPSFCSAVCHEPMNAYVEGYFSKDDSILASTHQKNNVTCLKCHETNLGQQVSEGAAWISGNYSVPLEKRDYASEETCLKSGCHNMTREELTQKTAHLKRNPHDWSMHGTLNYECGDCHSMHGQQVDQCAGCHGDIQPTKGWLPPAQAN